MPTSASVSRECNLEPFSQDLEDNKRIELNFTAKIKDTKASKMAKNDEKTIPFLRWVLFAMCDVGKRIQSGGQFESQFLVPPPVWWADMKTKKLWRNAANAYQSRLDIFFHSNLPSLGASVSTLSIYLGCGTSYALLFSRDGKILAMVNLHFLMPSAHISHI